MSRLAPLLLIGLAGCWPRIPGSWKDYDLSDETRLAGYLLISEPQGGYWTDDSPTSEALLGWYGAPKLDVDLGRLFHPTGTDGCADAADLDQDWLYDGFEDLGHGELVLNGPSGDIALEFEYFSNTPDAYGGQPDPDDIVPDGAYALASFESPVGTVSVPEIVHMPRPLGFDGPQLDGTNPEVAGTDELTFGWVPRETDERVLAMGYLLDADFNALEAKSCLAPMSAGSITIDDAWDDVGDATYVYVRLAVLAETATALEGDETASRMLGVHEIIGVLELE